MIRKHLFIALMHILILVSVSSAGILEDLTAKQATIRTVSASFSQEKKTKLLTKPLRTDGRFLYRQPDRIRWEYRGNMDMQVIFNGKDLWIYYPDLKEADRLSNVAQYGSLMHFDVFAMSRDYTITARKERGMILLVFMPKTNGPVSRIEMEIPEESSFPRTVRLLDRNNDPTIITFRDIVLNPVLEDSTFLFAPAKGVTVRDRSLR